MCKATWLMVAGLAAMQFLAVDGRAQEVKPWKNVTETVGLKGLGGGVIHWIDFDSDGWVDLFDGGGLWHNEGGKSFKRVESPGLGGGGSWGDFDGDGNLDLVVDEKDLEGYYRFASGTGTGDSSWYDFNLDGKTDAADLAIIDSHFGQRCKPENNASVK